MKHDPVEKREPKIKVELLFLLCFPRSLDVVEYVRRRTEICGYQVPWFCEGERGRFGESD